MPRGRDPAPVSDADGGTDTWRALLDVVDRASQGPVVDEKVFDLEHVAAGIRRVVQDYEITLDRDVIVHTELLHRGLHLVAGEDAHQIVVEGKEEA